MDYLDRKNRFYIDSDGSLRNTMGELIQKDENSSLVISANNAYIENNSIVLNQYSFKTDSVIGRRMFEYWPIVVQIIVDFQGIIASEYPEFEMGWQATNDALNNAFLTTMNEARIKQWEELLHLSYADDDTLEMRRNAIIARIRGQGKLNTETINSIVSAFTDGTARSYIQNSTLYVWILPSDTNKEYKFQAIEDELMKRKPAHLGLAVMRTFQSWGDIKRERASWSAASDAYETWNDVFYDIVSN